jgi:hypothetical protein
MPGGVKRTLIYPVQLYATISSLHCTLSGRLTHVGLLCVGHNDESVIDYRYRRQGFESRVCVIGSIVGIQCFSKTILVVSSPTHSRLCLAQKDGGRTRKHHGASTITTGRR